MYRISGSAGLSGEFRTIRYPVREYPALPDNFPALIIYANFEIRPVSTHIFGMNRKSQSGFILGLWKNTTPDNGDNRAANTTKTRREKVW
jgi:hypothetical protein